MSKQIVEDITEAYLRKDVDTLKRYIKEGSCKIVDGKLVIEKALVKTVKSLATYWDEQQYVRKIIKCDFYQQ